MVSKTFLNRKDFRFSSLGSSSFGGSAFLIGVSAAYNESTTSFKGIVKIISTQDGGSDYIRKSVLFARLRRTQQKMSLGALCGALVGCVILEHITHGEEIGVCVSGAQNIAQGVEWRAHRVGWAQ